MRRGSISSSSHGSDTERSKELLILDCRSESGDEHEHFEVVHLESSTPRYGEDFHRSQSSRDSYSSNSTSDSEASTLGERRRRRRKQRASIKSILSATEPNKTRIFGDNVELDNWRRVDNTSSDGDHENDEGDFLMHGASAAMSFREASPHDVEEKRESGNVAEEKISDGDMGQSSSGERMPYAVVEDPRNFIITMIIDSSTGSVDVQDIFRHLAWDVNYEKTYGPVSEYLQGYHSVFVLSPIDDRVTLCRPVLSSLRKRELKRHKNKKRTEGELISAHIGSISCSCVAEKIILEDLAALYSRRGYVTELKYGVLHVSAKHMFDIFAFENGIIVWWGMDRCDHWLVEDDFFSTQTPASQTLRSPFSMKDIRELYPDWSSYEVDDTYFSLKVDEKASERFSKMLCFDHYRIPMKEPDRSHVMMTVSFCLGRSACIDYYEHVTKTLHQQVLSIPLEFSGLMEYFSTQKVVRSLEGELQVTQLALTTLKDTPNFLWEMPWLQGFYTLTELQCSSEHRVSWFCARGDALLQSLSSTKNRRFRLFMLGSDVFLIALLVFDVFFMTARLIVKLYFKLEED